LQERDLWHFVVARFRHQRCGFPLAFDDVTPLPHANYSYFS
jgi:hypothetical protein